MSENQSIEEIINRAQEIKSEAQKRLEEAEKSLNIKAKQAIDDVVVDEEAVAKRIAEAYERTEEEDVKEYVLSKDSPEGDDGKTKVIPKKEIARKTGEADADSESSAGDEKTVRVSLPGKGKKDKISAENDSDEDDGDVKIFKINEEKEKSGNEEVQPSFISTAPEKEPDGDLETIPTIVSAQSVNNFNNDQKESRTEPEAGTQIKLEGFDEDMDSVEKVDEKVVEKELEKRREKKVGKFRLFGPDETDSHLGESPVEAEEYEHESEKDTFSDSLFSKRSALTVKLLITVVLLVPLILLSAFKDSANLPLFLSSDEVYFSVLSGIYLLALIVNFNVIARGFNFKNGFNSDTPLSVASVLILAHSVLMIFNSGIWYDSGVALDAAVTFGIFMSQLSKRNMISRLISNFDFITGKKEKYTVENITNNVDAQIIARNIIESDEPILKMSVKCDFPSNFLEISCKKEPADKISKRIFITDVILCAVFFGVSAFLKNVNSAINFSLSALVISLPAASLYLSGAALNDVCGQLSYYDSVVCGYEGAYTARNTDALVMEAADLFANNSCDFHGIKTFGGAKIDDAIIYAASVMIQTKSPLARVFDDIIIGKQSILPRVDDIVYEEKMGTSAWVYNKKILVGTREMMKRHDVSLPKLSFEEKYTVKGRKALYLAIDGKLTAMFIVSYNADPDLKRELKKLEKTGITLIVKSSDPYINEESLNELFALPDGFIRVMNYSAARVYDKYSNLDVEKSPAYVVHGGTALGVASAFRGAGKLVSSVGAMSFLETFGSVIGIIGTVLLCIFNSFGEVSSLSIIIYQAIWTIFSFIVMKLKNLGV